MRSAAYRHRARMRSEALDREDTYENRGDDLVHEEINLPKDAPEWAQARYGDKALALELDGREATDEVLHAAKVRVSERLWNDVERYENQYNRRRDSAQYARELTISLPRELSLEENVALAREYIGVAFTDLGMIADWVVHWPEKNGQANPHVHVMLSMRPLSEDSTRQFGNKERSWNPKSVVKTWRFQWAEMANKHLERAGVDARIDHRSYADQGLEIEPTSFDERHAEHVEGKGEASVARALSLEARERNEAYLIENPEHMIAIVGSSYAVFTEEQIREGFIDRLLVSGEEIDALVGRAMASRDLVALPHEEFDFEDGKQRYTTRARALMDAEIARGAETMHRGSMGLVDQGAALVEVDLGHGPRPDGFGRGVSISEVESLPGFFNPAQVGGAVAMLDDRRLSVITGYAGVGKTTVVKEAARIWQERGYSVYGAAPSGKATQELSDIDGMEVRSLAAWEAEFNRGRDLGPKSVFFMDEAGMVSGDVWARVQHQLDLMGSKLNAIGDGEQLSAVNDPGAMDFVAERVGQTVMDVIVRQRDPMMKEATRALALDNPSAALNYYGSIGALTFTAEQGAAIDNLVESYFERDLKGHERIALAYPNKEVAELNDRLRMKAGEMGLLDFASEHQFGKIVRKGMNADGTLWKEKVPRNIAPGDRLIFRSALRDQMIAKSAMATVKAVRVTDDISEIDIVVDKEEKTRTVDMKKFRDFDYAYAATVHKSQGMTVEHCEALAHPGMNKNIGYVLATRHEGTFCLHGSAERKVGSVGGVVAAFSRKEKNLVYDQGLSSDPSLSAVSGLDGLGEAVTGRADFVADPALMGSLPGFEGDPHLHSVMRRTAGLLSGEWEPDMPVYAPELSATEIEALENAPLSVIDDLAKRHSVITGNEVADVISSKVKDPETFLRLFREAMAHPDLVTIGRRTDGVSGAIEYSTTTQVQAEIAAVDAGVRLARRGERRREYSKKVAAAAARGGLLAEIGTAQERALAHALGSSGLMIIRGGSGSGKTQIAGCAAQELFRQGKDVHVLAKTHGGLRGLDAALRAMPDVEAGAELKPKTIASLRYQIEQGRLVLHKDSVLLIDNAEQLGAEEAGWLFDQMQKSGGRMVTFLDKNGLGSLNAGPVMPAIGARAGVIDVHENMRVRSSDKRSALKLLSDKSFAGGEVVLQSFKEAFAIKAGGTREQTHAALAESYVSDPHLDKLILAHGRGDVEALNKAVRASLHSEVSVDAGDGAVIPDLLVGDRIEIMNRLPALGIERATVADVVGRSDGDWLELRIGMGHEAQFVQLRTTDPEFSWRYGFASTIHARKGRSVESAHLMVTRGMDRAVLGVGLNLHEGDISLVVHGEEDAKTAVLRSILEREGTSRTTLDHGFEAAYAAREAELRRQAEAKAMVEIDAPWIEARTGSGASTSGLKRLGQHLSALGFGESDAPIPADRIEGVSRAATAEVIGADILLSGDAPNISTYTEVGAAFDRVSRARHWKSVSADIGSAAEARVAKLISSAGAEVEGRALPVGTLLARSAVMAEHYGDDDLAIKLHDGLKLYGARVQGAIGDGSIAELDIATDRIAREIDGAGRSRVEADRMMAAARGDIAAHRVGREASKVDAWSNAAARGVTGLLKGQSLESMLMNYMIREGIEAPIEAMERTVSTYMGALGDMATAFGARAFDRVETRGEVGEARETGPVAAQPKDRAVSGTDWGETVDMSQEPPARAEPAAVATRKETAKAAERDKAAAVPPVAQGAKDAARKAALAATGKVLDHEALERFGHRMAAAISERIDPDHPVHARADLAGDITALMQRAHLEGDYLEKQMVMPEASKPKQSREDLASQQARRTKYDALYPDRKLSPKAKARLEAILSSGKKEPEPISILEKHGIEIATQARLSDARREVFGEFKSTYEFKTDAAAWRGDHDPIKDMHHTLSEPVAKALKGRTKHFGEITRENMPRDSKEVARGVLFARNGTGADKSLGEAMDRAVRAGGLKSWHDLTTDRKEALNDLMRGVFAGLEHAERSEALHRLSASFTHTEIKAMASLKGHSLHHVTLSKEQHKAVTGALEKVLDMQIIRSGPWQALLNSVNKLITKERGHDREFARGHGRDIGRDRDDGMSM